MIIFPEPLKKEDKVAIISPATTVKEEYVRGACREIESRGFVPVIMPSALGPADGSFASSRELRLSDLRDAIADPEVRAIFCSRGGYGCVQLLGDIEPEDIRHDPKWLVGFSDISALHALWHRAGVASVHGPMAKHLALESSDDCCTEALFGLLTGSCGMAWRAPAFEENRIGNARGVLKGGNLAVLDGLSGTPFNLLSVNQGEDVVLFVEDIAEPIYKVERMLYNLLYSGVLRRIKGLIVGQFTEYRPDVNYESVEKMISAFLSRCGIDNIPVAFGFPVGHVSLNYPLIEGAEVEFNVTSEGSSLKSV